MRQSSLPYSTLPLNEAEHEAFERLIRPNPLSETEEFEAWLAEEIFSQQRVPSAHQWFGLAGILTGAVSSLVSYYLAVQLMKIFELSDRVASTTGVLVLIPRAALAANGLEDAILKILHDRDLKNKLPRKNNQPYLRQFSDGFVYVSSFSLGLMGVYFLQTNLPYKALARAILTPTILLGYSVVNVQPFLDVNQALFAKFSPGENFQVIEKRAALIHCLNLALEEIKAKNNHEFGLIYQDLSGGICSSQEARTRWEKLLAYGLNSKQPPAPPKSEFTKARGYFGWTMALLSSLTNIQVCLAEALWYASVLNLENDEFIQSFGWTTSLLCFTAYGILCAEPTREIFEYQLEKTGWLPTHPELRKGLVGVSLVLGGYSALPNVLWPVILGTTWYEQALAAPAFIASTALFFNALNKRLNRWLNWFDRYYLNSPVIDHTDFLDKLKTLPAAVAQLPDQHIEKLVPTDAPLLLRYRTEQEQKELICDMKKQSTPSLLSI